MVSLDEAPKKELHQTTDADPALESFGGAVKGMFTGMGNAANGGKPD